MPGFSTRADMVSEIALGKVDQFTFDKTAPAVGTAGTWQSLWLASGGLPAVGGAPAGTPGTTYSSDQSAQVAGTMWFPDRSTDLKFLLKIGVMATQACTLLLYDRLVAVSGFSVIAGANKVVTSSAVPRYSGTAAINNEAWVELSSATTTAVATINLSSYTSADGTAAQVGGTVVTPLAITPTNTMIQLPLTAALRGIRSIESGITVTGTAGGGTFNAVILQPIARLAVPANNWIEFDFFDDDMLLPQIFDNAALALAVQLTTAATAIQVRGQITTVYG